SGMSAAMLSAPTKFEGDDERTGFQRQAGSGGRRLQRHRQRHRAGVPGQGRARVQVCGTRASAADYSASEGSQLGGLDYAQLDVSDAEAIVNFKPPFDRLDVLVLAQGAVIYRRGEFEMAGFRKVLEVNLMSLMACAGKFHKMLSASHGSLIIVSSTAAYHSTKGNPAYNASKTGAVGLTRTLGQAWAEGWHPRQRHRARPRRYQDDQGDDIES